MNFGIALPSWGPGASSEGILAAGEAAVKLGWTTVWVTDHLIVQREPGAEYERIFEAMSTLAFAAGRFPTLRLGASAICVPLRQAPLLAKEIASLDALSGGRVHAIAVGLGEADDIPEYANLGVASRFERRGAYLDETIRLWRHLWSGNQAPFQGEFHQLVDFCFQPLPVRRDNLPIWVGGRSRPAWRRAANLADGYHGSRLSPAEFAECLPPLRSFAEAAGRPLPELSVRVRVKFDAPAVKKYTLTGSPDQMRAELHEFAAMGIEHVVLSLDVTSPDDVARVAERFARDVIAGL
ncbi:MAG: TIGR03619 family F420-dependent LLM class oxidoreductase [Chloroflexi bacterium]|nr:TIGR03619 family F420-dependent LLM class oxidoreductase [Chloroflexota bacterium]